MNLINIRPRFQQVAFQWDGEYVEGFSRITVGTDMAHQPVYNLVAVNGDGAETFAEPGDWIVSSAIGGHFVWAARDFDAAYEVIDP